VTTLREHFVISLLIAIVIGASAWPIFASVNVVIGYFIGEGSIIDLWMLEPKRKLIDSFIEGYIGSAKIAGLLGLVAAIDYLILARFKLTGYFAGIGVPAFCIAIAFHFYKVPSQVMLGFGITAFILWIIYKLIDVGIRVRRTA